jgi:phosphatidylglycerol:prolipoprotein diacylglycerol transferase
MSLFAQSVLYWALAVVLILSATAITAQRARLDSWTMYLAGMAGFCGALLVGWIYVALSEHGPHADGGGRAAIGAFIGAALFGWLIVRLRGAKFLLYADAAVPGIALGYAVYRIGCFMNGCCFGIPTDMAWGVSYAPGTEAFAAQVAAGLIDPNAAHSLAVHPTQLYHAAAGALMFLGLTRLANAWPGRRLAGALLGYAVSRFVIEFFRGDAQPVWGALDLDQISCIAMVAIGLFIWWRSHRNARNFRELAA